MVKKADRQRRILELVHEHEVATQTELQQLLKQDGIEVDQGTVSRDIRELGFVRVPTPDGFKYAPVEEASPVVPMRSEKLAGRLVKSAEKSRNLIVLKTDPGNAQVVGLAIDKLGWREVVGTVAGDDTLLVVVREGVPASRVVKKILELREK
jgi:transcriptional regulator of arginine metabolism